MSSNSVNKKAWLNILFLFFSLVIPVLSLASEMFSPGKEDLFVIDMNKIKKEIVSIDSCKEPWPFKKGLTDRIKRVKTKKIDLDYKSYDIQKKDKFCYLFFLKNKNMQGQGREECIQSIVEESKDYVVIDPNREIANDTDRQIIVAGREKCNSLLEKKVSEGFVIKNPKTKISKIDESFENEVNSAELKAKCDKGDLEACFEQGTPITPEEECDLVGMYKCYFRSFEPEVSDENKTKYLKKACDLGHSEACKKTGSLCKNGNYEMCLTEAMEFEEKKNYKKAFELYDKACRARVDKACAYATVLASDIKDKKKELHFIKTRCEMGNMEVCKVYKENEFTGSDSDLKGCLNGDLAVCNGNYMYLLKNKKYNLALTFLEPACKKDDYYACLLIGTHYTETNQLEKSKPYFVKSCGANLYKGCLGAGIVSKSQNDKIKFFEKACLGKESFGCSNLGDIYFNKKVFDLSVASYDKGCLLNNVESCERKCTALAKLETSGYDIISCLSTACNQGGSQSCEAKNILLAPMKKSRNEHDRKMKLIESAKAEDKRRRDLVNDLSAAANQLGKAIAGGQQDNNSYNTYSGSGEITCGIKPIPNLGCQIGRCIDGQWEQVCNTCGIKPIPQIGCQIGRCVSGQWEQICNTCGIKPIPRIGCRVENCVNGQWEQVCN